MSELPLWILSRGTEVQICAVSPCRLWRVVKPVHHCHMDHYPYLSLIPRPHCFQFNVRNTESAVGFGQVWDRDDTCPCCQPLHNTRCVQYKIHSLPRPVPDLILQRQDKIGNGLGMRLNLLCPPPPLITQGNVSFFPYSAKFEIPVSNPLGSNFLQVLK